MEVIIPFEIHNTVSITKQWIDWQLNQYFSLATQISSIDSHSQYRGGQRHWWKALANHWLNEPVAEAADDIVVHLANDKALLLSLRSIAKNPTSNLVTIRKKIPTGKTLQMDAVCLRDLEQKPGCGLLEKAMAVPRILSLHRTHSYTTLENKVFFYLLGALIERAERYLYDNCEFEYSRRVQDVKKFLAYLKEIDKQTSHIHCLELQPSLSILPNNCLLYDRYYNVIWITFRRLLLIERTTQDALLYQNTLWKETGRQLLGAILSSRLPKCRALAESCAYIKRDMQEGRWTEHCSFPGPFQWHRRSLSFVDVWDPEPDLFGSKILDYLDADQLLIASHASRSDKQCAIWYFHKPFDEPLDVDCLMVKYDESLEAISKVSGSNIYGLIIGSASFGNATIFRKQGNLIYLTFPTDFSSKQEEIISAVQQALEFFLEDL